MPRSKSRAELAPEDTPAPQAPPEPETFTDDRYHDVAFERGYPTMIEWPDDWWDKSLAGRAAPVGWCCFANQPERLTVFNRDIYPDELAKCRFSGSLWRDLGAGPKFRGVKRSGWLVEWETQIDRSEVR